MLRRRICPRKPRRNLLEVDTEPLCERIRSRLVELPVVRRA